MYDFREVEAEENKKRSLMYGKHLYGLPEPGLLHSKQELLTDPVLPGLFYKHFCH